MPWPLLLMLLFFGALIALWVLAVVVSLRVDKRRLEKLARFAADRGLRFTLAPADHFERYHKLRPFNRGRDRESSSNLIHGRRAGAAGATGPSPLAAGIEWSLFDYSFSTDRDRATSGGRKGSISWT